MRPPHSRPPAALLIRVLIVDDHPVVRRGLSETINEEPGLLVCATTGSAAHALELVATMRPDVAIVDLALGDDSGLSLVSAITGVHPGVRVLVLSAHDERVYAERVLRAGALGYITKERPAEELLQAIRAVAAGRLSISTDAEQRLLSSTGTQRPAGGAGSPVDRLSDRELQVLTLVGRGLGTREIAEHLRVSVKTIESHYAHIKEKLGLRNGRELTRLAVTFVEGLTPGR